MKQCWIKYLKNLKIPLLFRKLFSLQTDHHSCPDEIFLFSSCLSYLADISQVQPLFFFFLSYPAVFSYPAVLSPTQLFSRLPQLVLLSYPGVFSSSRLFSRLPCCFLVYPAGSSLIPTYFLVYPAGSSLLPSYFLVYPAVFSSTKLFSHLPSYFLVYPAVFSSTQLSCIFCLRNVRALQENVLASHVLFLV